MKFYRNKKLLDLLKILLENGADFKLKNIYHYSSLALVILNKDKLIVSIIYDYYLERYNFKYKRRGDEFVKYLKI